MEETQKRTSKAKVAIIGMSCAALVAASAGTLAYLTDSNSKTNEFNVVPDLSIQVVEPGWDAASQVDTDTDGIKDVMELVPGQTITKDPAITNKNMGTTGDGADSWVFMQVKIPIANVETAQEDGTIIPAKETELFSYEKSSEKWVQMGDKKKSQDGNYMVYWYAYNEKLAPDKTTDKLFESVTYANVTENEMDGKEEQQIDITGYGIQSHGFDDYSDAWNAFATQNNFTTDAPSV